LDTLLVNDLIGILDEEANIYEEVLNISKDKKDIIIAGKVTDLEKLVKVEQTLILKISGLELKREQLVDKLSAQIRADSNEITVSELLKHLEGEQAAALRKRQEKIIDVINELRNTNALNSKLIKNSLDFINFSMNLIASFDVNDNNYGNNGQSNDSKKRNLFDIKL